MEKRLGVRQNTLPLNPNAFYTLWNDKLARYTLSLGPTSYHPGPFNMTIEHPSSENWQLYAQGGRFFIRNYDHTADYQLALDEASREVPVMLRTSGDLGHQWSITRIEEGTYKGKWRLTNGLLGNGTMLVMGTVGTIPVARMFSGEEGSAWDIRMNIPPDTPNGDTPQNMGMMFDVQSMEVASTSTSTSISTSTSMTLSSSQTLSSSPASTLNSSVTLPTSSETPSPKSRNLSKGAIAGIATSGILFTAAIFALIFLLLKRRKKNSPYQHHYPARTEKPSELEVYERTQELGPGPKGGYRNTVPVEMG